MPKHIQPGELSSNERRFLRCILLGHKWIQPEGIFTKRYCSRCGVLDRPNEPSTDD